MLVQPGWFGRETFGVAVVVVVRRLVVADIAVVADVAAAAALAAKLADSFESMATLQCSSWRPEYLLQFP